MAHLFPLQNLHSTAKRTRREEDDSWRACQSFIKVDISPPPATDYKEQKVKRKKKRRRHFKKDDEGTVFLRTVSEIKRLCKHTKYSTREVVVEGMLVEGERSADADDGAQCPFRSLPALGAHAERMRLADGDIVLLLAEQGPTSTQKLTDGEIGKDGKGGDFWESGMPMDVLIQCKGRVTCEQVAINTLYKGDDEDADLYVPKGTARVYKLKATSWSFANKLPPAITDSSTTTSSSSTTASS